MKKPAEIPFATVKYMHEEIREELLGDFEDTLNTDWFIRGVKCEVFENKFAAYCGTEYCVCVDNGLKAIYLSLLALGIGAGDEVIVPANTFIATALAVSRTGARVVPVEPHIDTYTIDANSFHSSITAKTRAVIPVHLYGQCADMDKIIDYANNKGIYVIEDAAQAHGALYKNKKAGSLGMISAFSFYPGKNLGALGDGGAVVTNDPKLARKVKSYSNYGSEKRYYHVYKGTNSRLDEVQAGFLTIKLQRIDFWNSERARIAERYRKGIQNPQIILPVVDQNCRHVWHIFAIRCKSRDRLQKYLRERGIETLIHYPFPINKQMAYQGEKMPAMPIAEEISSQVLSLPLYYGMKDEEVEYVMDAVNAY
jgi:dTDP-4-amino-4,6-dideoxygalactose transaminase